MRPAHRFAAPAVPFIPLCRLQALCRLSYREGVTIDVTPEVKAAIDERLSTDTFVDVDELLTKALAALPRKAERPRRTRAEAIAHIRQIRQGVSLGGLKIKDLVNEGRP
jgi:Arc/MetJ-type ribon-helix-helix transcriptional regulator